MRVLLPIMAGCHEPITLRHRRQVDVSISVKKTTPAIQSVPSCGRVTALAFDR